MREILNFLHIKLLGACSTWIYLFVLIILKRKNFNNVIVDSSF